MSSWRGIYKRRHLGKQSDKNIGTTYRHLLIKSLEIESLARKYRRKAYASNDVTAVTVSEISDNRRKEIRIDLYNRA